MTGSEALDACVERALGDALGLTRTPLGMETRREVDEGGRDVAVSGPPVARQDLEGTPVHRFGLLVTAASVHDRRQRRKIARHVRVLRSEQARAKVEPSPCERLGASVPAAGVLEPSEIVMERRQLGGIVVPPTR